jgi:MOSC domain-containing protein YiiM
MKIVSVNVGMPRLVERNGEMISTGIFKTPVAGKIKVNQFNLEGDAQADLDVHGGWSKSVYAYPAEHYDYWQKHLPEMALPFSIFGENLTTEGLLENEVFIGDQFQIGSARFVVTEPRFPCYKLGIRFNRPDIIARFHLSGRSGFYLAVLKTGELQAGDKIEIIEKNENHVSITDILRFKNEGIMDREKMRRALNIEVLPQKLKLKIKNKLDEDKSG